MLKLTIFSHDGCPLWLLWAKGALSGHSGKVGPWIVQAADSSGPQMTFQALGNEEGNQNGNVTALKLHLNLKRVLLGLIFHFDNES